MEDVNDNPPSFPLSSVRISVAESHPLHTALYVARASDPDLTPATPICYGLNQNSNELFGIDARSGELYLVRRLDYETQQRHRLLISAFDGAGLSANLSLNVEVQDVNDNPPVFERNEYYVEVAEGARLNSQVRIKRKSSLDALASLPTPRGAALSALAEGLPPRLLSARKLPERCTQLSCAHNRRESVCVYAAAKKACLIMKG